MAATAATTVTSSSHATSFLGMRTATIDQVLGPVADAIGELLLANEEAELNDQPLGDLYPVAVGVNESVKGLLSVASSMIEKTQDEDLKIDMPLACHEVEQAAEKLLKSTQALRNDPLNQQLRATMIEGARGILTGTQRVLECFDDYEVRKILAACQVSRDQVAQLRKAEKLQDLVTVLQPTAQSLVNVANLADKRIDELLDPWLKVELTQARDTIRTSSTLLVSSCKVFVMNVTQPSARESRDLTADRLTKAISEVERIVKLREPPMDMVEARLGRLAAQRVALLESMMEIANAVAAQDHVRLEAAINKFNPAANEILDSARALADRISDPEKKAQLKEIIGRIEALRPQIEAAARYALEHPDDPEAQRRLLELLKEMDREFEQLERVMNEAAIDDINRAFYHLSDPNNEDSTVARLIRAAKAGDTAAVDAISKEFANQVKALRDAANHAAATTSDPDAARAIYAAQRYLDDLYPQLVAAARTVAFNPNDQAAQEHLAAVVGEWESAVTRLKDAVANAQKPDEVLEATARALRTDLSDFERACVTQNADLLKAASKAITSKIQTVNGVVQREINNSDDPEYQAKLRIQQSELNQALPELQGHARALFLNPNDNAARKNLQASSDKLVQKVENIQATVSQHAQPMVENKWATLEAQVAAMEINDAQPQAIQIEGEDAILIDEPAPQLLDPEEAKANPIKASAMELKLEASKWDSKDNKMIQMSNKLADMMAKLSEFAKMETATSKKDLINAAKQIALDVKVIEEEARKLAEACTDKRLKADLLAMAQRLNTQSAQLKILATVKAANPGDNDNDQLLIGCATGLMAAVAQTIESSHSASIRTNMKSVANVAVAAVKWRRLVHKKDANAKPQSLASAVKATATASPAIKTAQPVTSTSPAAAASSQLKNVAQAAMASSKPATTTPAAGGNSSPGTQRATIGQPLVFRTAGKK